MEEISDVSRLGFAELIRHQPLFAQSLPCVPSPKSFYTLEDLVIFLHVCVSAA